MSQNLDFRLTGLQTKIEDHSMVAIEKKDTKNQNFRFFLAYESGEI